MAICKNERTAAFCTQKKPANSFWTGMCQNDAGQRDMNFAFMCLNKKCTFANDKIRYPLLCALHLRVNWLKRIKLFIEEYRNS